jgi:hypothetical protein
MEGSELPGEKDLRLAEAFGHSFGEPDCRRDGAGEVHSQNEPRQSEAQGHHFSGKNSVSKVKRGWVGRPIVGPQPGRLSAHC